MRSSAESLQLIVAAFEFEHGRECPAYRDRPVLEFDHDYMRNGYTYLCPCGVVVEVDDEAACALRGQLKILPKLGVVLHDKSRPQTEQVIRKKLERYYQLAADVTGGGVSMLDRFDEWCRTMKHQYSDMQATAEAMKGSRLYDRPMPLACQGDEDGDV